MPIKIAKEDASRILGRLDKLAENIQTNYQSWGMPFDQAKALVNDIDKTADEIEQGTFGPASLQNRQIEIVTGQPVVPAKTAQVIQRETDEKYMDTFKNPQQPRQIESDEPYMKAYGDDQSSGVIHGQAENGRKLAPGH
jgi:hypothetical protein